MIAPRRPPPPAFTLIEVLVTIALIALLVGLLLPTLGSARQRSRAAVCLSNLRQIGAAHLMYAGDFQDRCMPLAYWSAETTGDGPPVYWWGTNDPAGVDYTRGFLWPYLDARLSERSVLECPSQPADEYRAAGAANTVTSTYGYNGYYLCPPHTPGWAFQIGHRPWMRIASIRDSAAVFAFADTLIDLGGDRPFNCALLDPPLLFSGGNWTRNRNPTTAFRHADAAHAVALDGHAERHAAQRNWLTSARWRVGSVGRDNDPHYVPDWRDWRRP